MELEPLTALSPVDGRYYHRTVRLAEFFSEMAYMRYRVKVEVEYFIALCESGLPALKGVTKEDYPRLRAMYEDFDVEAARRVKAIERRTNHDVKAVEYFLKEEFEQVGGELADAKEYIHFGLTSQDINNTAIPMMLRDALAQVLLPDYDALMQALQDKVLQWQEIPMLARTHGQPASPTRLGKEVRVFLVRLEKQLAALKELEFPAKFGGATGNFNAHVVAFPDVDWHAFAEQFLAEQLKLQRSNPTTQIEHYDGLGQIFDNLKRINIVLTDLAVDCWLYISQDYFRQTTVANEVGSSAMPHKVNPIDFENAEGNLGFANAMYEFLSRKLPVSRLQRDLTDSTVIRNIGVGLAHSLLAAQSILRGLGKIEVNETRLSAELEDNWAVVAEALQTILRRERYPNPYEKLKDLTRGRHNITQEMIHAFIEGLDIQDTLKEEMRKVTPWNYTGQ